MKKSAFILFIALTTPFLVSAEDVHFASDTTMVDDSRGPAYKLLKRQFGCRSEPTDGDGSRNDCNSLPAHHNSFIEPPAGYALLGSTIGVTPINNEGDGHGCVKEPPTLVYDNEGMPLIARANGSANARSSGGINAIAGAVIAGLRGFGAAHLFNNLGTAGAVLCEISVVAKKIQ
ncbi:MAG: hypothetical protein N0E58_05070 [Candidatus Thiodiazotropha endolucinida]|uniref:Secreted protein n=1 Tax=Candidatus Thiodiazotropha taylori TaxID=2792791 RepID=A0A9E4NIS9_9GAMM|nr:hypothetical protein [Candidatus Thiodiazotropha sp. (ex Codakia orbicularis)]MCG7977495.1 hypothetical protein [Candidatus Thiodiazotropha taylori]MCW4235620.1 hypothetical protein [Candidatus Thiodiazotropha endolucinida]